MEIVFEVVNRAGRVLERHRASGLEVTIGRAFDNALILSDETVSPHHARIETNAEGKVLLCDLRSLNGIRTERHERVEGITELRSGVVYSFGRARVRIYSTAHAVAETVRIGGLDWLVNRLSSTQVLALIMLLASVVAITQQWLNTYSVIRWQQMGISVFAVLTVAAVIAAFWAIVGRVVKHEGRFKTHLALVLLYLLAQSAIYFCYELILFNSLSTMPSAVFGLGLSFGLLGTLIWLSLHVATSQSAAQRWKFALGATSIMLCLSIYPEILERTEFSTSPDYVKVMKPPVLRYSQGISAADFVEKSAATYGQTNHDNEI